MPSSAVRTFTDPDDYAAAIRQGTRELTVTERGEFTAKLTRIDLHRLWMQRLHDNLPRISHIAGWGGRAVITFRTQSGPSLLSGGVEMQPTNIVRFSEGQSYYLRSSGYASYGGMSLPVEEIAAVAEAMVAFDLTPPRDAMLVTPRPVDMARLQRLHAAAADLAENAPEIIDNPDAARGLEQALIEAMVACLAHSEDRENGLAQGQHAIVMRRFWRVVEENRSNRSTSRRYARRSGLRAGRCACAARSIWGWGQSAICCCAACIWRGGRCARQRRMRHL
jgi:hypothetical protein